MRSGAFSVRPDVHGWGALGLALVVGGAVLWLALAMVVGPAEPVTELQARGHAAGDCSSAAHAASYMPGAATRGHPCSQCRPVVLHEHAAVVGASHSPQLHHQGMAPRGRTRFQPDVQALLRLIRERQDAIIVAVAHRLRDASQPGQASHVADRPLLVTRPLRGPPARA
jgi:hypothetical protein